MIFETKRLIIRKLSKYDYADLCQILQDKEVMTAYEHAFSDSEVQQWLDNQLKRYEQYGFGLWAVILKETNQMIGQAGLTMQFDGNKEVLEIGYLFKKKYWQKGFATEAAIGCKKYAFEQLNYKKVYSIIRDNNFASQKVAIRNGMKLVGKVNKFYYNMNMMHFIYKVCQ